MDSSIILKDTTNKTNTLFPYQCNSDHITNLGGIAVLQHRKVGNSSHLPTRSKLKLWELIKKMSAGNKKVSNLVKIISLEGKLRKQVAAFVSNYVVYKVRCLFSKLLWSLYFISFCFLSSELDLLLQRVSPVLSGSMPSRICYRSTSLTLKMKLG